MEPKIMKNDALGAPGGLSGANRSQEGHPAAPGLRTGCHFNGKIRFGAPFWVQLGPKGGAKISLLGSMFEKNEKKEVLK